MSIRKWTAAVTAAVLLSGCATGYNDAKNPLLGMAGGYWDQKGPGELIKVGFAGNAYITKEKVGTYLLFRCAEVTRREGKTHFALYQSLPAAVADRRSSEKTVTTVTGKPTSYAYILLFDAPADGLLSAADVITRLGPEVKGEGKS